MFKKNGNLVLTVWWYFLEVCRPCNQSNPSTCGDQERRGKSLHRFHLYPNYWIPLTRGQTPKKNNKFILLITREKIGYISLTFNCFNWRQNETTFWGPLTFESMAPLKSLSNLILAAVWKTIVTLPLNICKSASERPSSGNEMSPLMGTNLLNTSGRSCRSDWNAF